MRIRADGANFRFRAVPTGRSVLRAVSPRGVEALRIIDLHETTPSGQPTPSIVSLGRIEPIERGSPTQLRCLIPRRTNNLPLRSRPCLSIARITDQGEAIHTTTVVIPRKEPGAIELSPVLRPGRYVAEVVDRYGGPHPFSRPTGLRCRFVVDTNSISAPAVLSFAPTTPRWR